MVQESELEKSLNEFAKAVERLVERPVKQPVSEAELEAELEAMLEVARDANLGSLRVMDLFYSEESNRGKLSLESTNAYTRLVSLCLMKFKEIMPSLDGQAWHVDLYMEQMRGRMMIIEEMYHGRNNFWKVQTGPN